jgi:aminocarboxymuconate-semialdehyde decarboxylase
LIDLVGCERVLLGSDYCFDMGYERPISAIDAHTSLTEAQRTSILSGNASQLLRIPNPLAVKGTDDSADERSNVYVAG